MANQLSSKPSLGADTPAIFETIPAEWRWSSVPHASAGDVLRHGLSHHSNTTDGALSISVSVTEDPSKTKLPHLVRCASTIEVNPFSCGPARELQASAIVGRAPIPSSASEKSNKTLEPERLDGITESVTIDLSSCIGSSEVGGLAEIGAATIGAQMPDDAIDTWRVPQTGHGRTNTDASSSPSNAHLPGDDESITPNVSSHEISSSGKPLDGERLSLEGHEHIALSDRVSACLVHGSDATATKDMVPLDDSPFGAEPIPVECHQFTTRSDRSLSNRPRRFDTHLTASVHPVDIPTSNTPPDMESTSLDERFVTTPDWKPCLTASPRIHATSSSHGSQPSFTPVHVIRKILPLEGPEWSITNDQHSLNRPLSMTVPSRASIPRVKKALDVERDVIKSLASKPCGYEYSVTVDRSGSDRPLGIEYYDSDGVSLVIHNMRPGLLYESMLKMETSCWVRLLDSIIEVNGISGDTKSLERECVQKKVLHLKFYRPACAALRTPVCFSRDPRVIVHVYDLQGLSSRVVSYISGALNTFSIDYGLYHTGVEVYGREWYFGYAENYFYGVNPMLPKHHHQHSYRMSVVMGETTLSCTKFEELIPLIRIAWPSFTYDVRNRNCHHFTDFFCQMLGFSSGPKFGVFGSGDSQLAHKVMKRHNSDSSFWMCGGRNMKVVPASSTAPKHEEDCSARSFVPL